MDLSVFQTQFTSLDWGIVAIYLLLIGAIGVWVNRYIKNVADYMVGGRATGLALNTASYIGTDLGLVTLMYAAIEGFTRGFAYLAIPLIVMVSALIIGRTGWVIRRFREMGLVTVPEYFERRFNKRIRVVSGIIMALAGILNMGLFPKMGATFITYATGLAATPDATQTVNIVMSVLIVLVLVYTVLGGMVAVIITDYLQFVVLSIGLLIALYMSLNLENQGWAIMTETVAKAKGEAAFNPFHAESYGGSYLLWMLAINITVCFCWGPSVSRALTADSPKTSQRTFLLAAPGQFIRMGIPALFALAAFAYFFQDPQLVQYFFPEGLQGVVNHPAEAMPLFLGKILPAGLIGVIVAGLLAAFMSTHDSYFLSWASVISRDIISPLKKGKVTDQQEIRYARIAIVCIGAFLLLWGLWYELPDSVWTYMAITGNVYLTGATAAILGGLYWEKASSTGAMAALLGGLVSLSGLFMGDLQTLIPGLKIGMLGLGNYVFCMGLLVVFSLLFPDNEEK